MALLSKADILSHTGSCETREVAVPSWGGEVLVRGMTLREFEVNQARAEEGKATASVLARCILADASGIPMFSKDEVNALAELPFKESQILSAAVFELSGITEPAEKDQSVTDASLVEAGKDSEPTQSEDSSSS